jgi:hypothetical protein
MRASIQICTLVLEPRSTKLKVSSCQQVRMHKGSYIDGDTEGTENQAMKKPKLRYYPWLEVDSNQDRWLLLVFAKRLICVDEGSNFCCMSSEDISSVKLDSNLLVIRHSSNVQLNRCDAAEYEKM